jgi:predicted phosphodiesterase
MNTYRRVAFFGGIHSNSPALAAALRMARSMRAEAVFALGDCVGHGPGPDRTLDLLREEGVHCLLGDIEEALAFGAADFRGGFSDPDDLHFTRLAYAHAVERTAPNHKVWMAGLPREIRFSLGDRRVLTCHGSPRRLDEPLFRSTTPDALIRRLLDDYEADLIVCGHTGLHWQRFLPDGRGLVNAGSLGRPANDGRTEGWFALVDGAGGRFKAQFLPVVFDHVRLAREMEEEGLPKEFRDAVLTGWWRAGLEILPAKERAQGRF